MHGDLQTLKDTFIQVKTSSMKKCTRHAAPTSFDPCPLWQRSFQIDVQAACYVICAQVKQCTKSCQLVIVDIPINAHHTYCTCTQPLYVSVINDRTAELHRTAAVWLTGRGRFANIRHTYMYTPIGNVNGDMIRTLLNVVRPRLEGREGFRIFLELIHWFFSL